MKAAVVIFYDSRGNIVVQAQGKGARLGQKYGFWGGELEKGESPRQGILRELREELNYTPKTLRLWKKEIHKVTQKGKYYNVSIEINVFVSPITDKLLASPIMEGDAMVVMKADHAEQNIDSLFGGIAIVKGLNDFISKF